eukprot:CAMPEP_0172665194 /NCGR_PEP_ID=MMETSP1074-20121228/7091_1 /TAXON_ID=2916 /ORGANISM="Ceratium fusus, Strain PA161109" /LENGTH=32 /DNA_ID= /DNA_START= /DNA_END= /DNA_ORIENTATION=
MSSLDQTAPPGVCSGLNVGDAKTSAVSEDDDA